MPTNTTTHSPDRCINPAQCTSCAAPPETLRTLARSLTDRALARRVIMIADNNAVFTPATRQAILEEVVIRLG